jgi:alpha-tubulin suppressor-like RCC1 family protein
MIEDAPVKIQYIGNGVTQTVTFPFRIYRQEDLQVISSSGGEDTVLDTEEGYRFLYGENDENGGAVYLASPIAIGQMITLVRVTPASQDLDLNPKQDFPAESTEVQLDRMSMAVQELREQVSRAIHYRVTEADIELPYLELPDWISRSGKIIGFDGNGHLKLYTIDLNNITVDLDLAIPDGSITDLKLAEILDLSSHTIILPAQSVTVGMLTTTLDLHNNTVILPENSIGDPQVLPYALSRESLNPTLRPSRVAVGYTTTLSIKVTGAADSAANRVYAPSGTVNGRTQYVADNGYSIAAESGAKRWVLYDAGSVALYSSEHKVWGSFSSLIETTPDQMPPWVVYGTSTPGPTVSIDTYELDVKGTVRADRFIGPFDTPGGGGTSNQEDTVVMFPRSGNINGIGGDARATGYGGMMFLGGKGVPRYLGYNETTDKPFLFNAATTCEFPLFKRLYPGLLAGLTAVSDGAGNTLASITPENIVKIVQCGRNAYLLTSNGLVYALGRNNEGQLGQNNTTNSSTFLGVKVGALSGKTIFITDIVATPPGNSTQGVTVAAIDIDGKVWTWGENGNGQCGATVGNKLVPYNDATWAFNAAIVTQVMILGKTTYALTNLGAVYGTGINTYGQIGDSSITQRTTFTLMTNTGGSIVVQSMHGYGADGVVAFLALNTSGDVYGCGNGALGTLGNNSLANTNGLLAACHSSINGGANVSRVFCLGPTVYAILSDGTILAWGYNGSYLLGNGNTTNLATAVSPANLNTLLGTPTSPDYITTIAMAGPGGSAVDAIHVLTSDSKVFSIGANSQGQLGTDITAATVAAFAELELVFTPVMIYGGHLGTGESRMFFQDNLGQLWMCGYSQYGNTGVIPYPAPIRI